MIALVGAFQFIPRARDKTPDKRFRGMTPGAVGLKILLILVGTVVLEELVFRGVLLAAWKSAYSPVAYAVVGSSIVFGLWHIGPALRDEERMRESAVPTLWELDEGERTRVIKDRRTSAVSGTVIAMVAVGVLFCLLRIWSRGIWAPSLVHFTANSGGVLFSWFSARHGP